MNYKIESRKYLRKRFYGLILPSNITNNYSELGIYGKDVNQRLNDHRKIVIPWLDSVVKLKNKRILEIGCGEGFSTLALAEQGAIVTAIDIDEDFLQTAKSICIGKDMKVDFHLLNACDVGNYFAGKEFDYIIFWASLEHMTIEERMQSMKDTFKMLPVGGLWCIIGSPNRLYYFDSHTSDLPFFHWLPDEIAIKYSVNSLRSDFNNCMRNLTYNPQEKNTLYRWGRGISFHEIELALKPLRELNIVSTLLLYNQNKSFILKLLYEYFLMSKFELYLQNKFPMINPCFFQPYLNLVIRK